MADYELQPFKMIEELSDSEEFFIWVLRSFDFLRLRAGFHGCEFLNTRDGKSVSLCSYKKKKKVTIIEECISPDSYYGLDIYVETIGLFGILGRKKTLKDYFGPDVRVESIRRLAKMVQEHEGLMKELVG